MTGIIIRCKFSKCSDTSVKIYNDFDEKNYYLKALYQNDQEYGLISNCIFESGPKSKSSIFYFGGNNAALFKLHKCTFTGDLPKGANHIDGQLTNRYSPKLIVNSCKFACNYLSVFNNNNNFLSIDLKDQIFNSNVLLEEKFKSKYKIYTAIITPIFAILVIVITIITYRRKNLNQSVIGDIDELEMPIKKSEEKELDQKLI